MYNKSIVSWFEERPRRGMGGVEWIDLAQNEDKRWAVVDALMNIRFP